MTALQPGTRYYYRVGDPSFQYWSNPEWCVVVGVAMLHDTDAMSRSQPPDFTFITRAQGLSSARMAVVGDMGVTDISSDTVHTLADLTANGQIDFVFHTGDIAYSDGM